MKFMNQEITQTRWEQLLFGVLIALITAFFIWVFKEMGLWLRDVVYIINEKRSERKLEKERDELIKQEEHDFLFPQARLELIRDKVRNKKKLSVNDFLFLEKLHKDNRLDDPYLKKYYGSIEHKAAVFISSIGKAEDYIKL